MNALVGYAAVLALAAGPVYADCTYPRAPTRIPDGSTASLDEMMAAKQEVKEYNDATSAYLSCIQQERDDAIAKQGDKISAPDRAKLEHIEAEKHNAAIAQLQGIADRFNEQVRAFKAKNKN